MVQDYIFKMEFYSRLLGSGNRMSCMGGRKFYYMGTEKGTEEKRIDFNRVQYLWLKTRFPYLPFPSHTADGGCSRRTVWKNGMTMLLSFLDELESYWVIWLLEANRGKRKRKGEREGRREKEKGRENRDINKIYIFRQFIHSAYCLFYMINMLMLELEFREQ